MNRNLQLQLRDVEVANDDFERQARNTTSSLQDIESKFNVALERSVLLEEEVKTGEKEREELRIESQRLRDELSDLKVEAEIRQEKLRNAEAAAERARQPLATSVSRPQSSVSERSPIDTTPSSPTIATPPTKSVSSTASDVQTPPSPPTSDKSLPRATITPAQSSKPRPSLTNSITPRPLHYSTRPPRHSRGPSASINGPFATPAARRSTLSRPEPATLPSSTSLTQIRGLIGKMQKLEQRVHSARSKLPAPTSTPPRASPRPGSALSQSHIPSNITVRSSRKRTSASNSNAASSTLAREERQEFSTRPSSRLSFGLPPPTPTREINTTRPSSRASLSSRQSMSNLPSGVPGNSRPSSRQSTRTPLGHYPTNAERVARPRSSVGGSYTAVHGHSGSVSRLSNYGLDESPDNGEDVTTPTPTPSFRNSISGKEVGSAIPMPSKRMSGAGMGGGGRRISSGLEKAGDMGPPERRKPLKGIGETY